MSPGAAKVPVLGCSLSEGAEQAAWTKSSDAFFFCPSIFLVRNTSLKDHKPEAL